MSGCGWEWWGDKRFLVSKGENKKAKPDDKKRELAFKNTTIQIKNNFNWEFYLQPTEKNEKYFLYMKTKINYYENIWNTPDSLCEQVYQSIGNC